MAARKKRPGKFSTEIREARIMIARVIEIAPCEGCGVPTAEMQVVRSGACNRRQHRHVGCVSV